MIKPTEKQLTFKWRFSQSKLILMRNGFFCSRISQKENYWFVNIVKFILRILVQSRYRSMSVSKKRVPASSPQRDTVPSFNISVCFDPFPKLFWQDSVASSIPSRKTNYSLSLKTHSKHSPFLSDEELSKLSNQTIWKFLVLKSKRALENQEFTENVCLSLQSDIVFFLNRVFAIQLLKNVVVIPGLKSG